MLTSRSMLALLEYNSKVVNILKSTGQEVFQEVVVLGEEFQRYTLQTYLGPSFLRHLNLATLANFWKSLNLSGAKIKMSLFFHFSTKRDNGKKIKRITTKHRSILRQHNIQCTKYSVLLLITFMFFVFIIVVLSRPSVLCPNKF